MVGPLRIGGSVRPGCFLGEGFLLLLYIQSRVGSILNYLNENRICNSTTYMALWNEIWLI